jgi:hypothetical protein
MGNSQGKSSIISPNSTPANELDLYRVRSARQQNYVEHYDDTVSSDLLELEEQLLDIGKIGR